jgi:hypothetical protein
MTMTVSPTPTEAAEYFYREPSPDRPLESAHDWYGFGFLVGMGCERPHHAYLRWYCGKSGAHEQYALGMRAARDARLYGNRVGSLAALRAHQTRDQFALARCTLESERVRIRASIAARALRIASIEQS